MIINLKPLFILFAALMPAHAAYADTTYGNLTDKTVGAAAMPERIESLANAPFKMKDLRRPTFPDRSVTVTEAAVAADGKITKAVNGMITD